LFKLDWRDVADMAVATSWVVERFDVVEHIGACLVAGRIRLSLDSLALEQLEKALDDGVVVAVAASAHAGSQAVGSQKGLPVVAALIGMDKHLVLRFTLLDGGSPPH